MRDGEYCLIGDRWMEVIEEIVVCFVKLRL